ncbi:unnamed protein product [Linum trigynum]|uniref:Uncharacterized protein n=1 Tax=Linum trigynum TaxID=586398 RepID=A0AAV2CHV0_9ROSI
MFQQQEFSQQPNQRWVHLPLTICEALTFGDELVAEEQKEDEEEDYSSPEMRRRSYRRYHGFEKIDFDYC